MVVVVFDDMALLDAVGPIEVFAAASRLTGGGYRVLTASVDGAAVRSSSGVTMQVDAALDDITEPVDTLIVAGGLTVPDVVARSSLLVAGVRALAARARRACSDCTGAFILAAAGLLADRTVTTHWSAARELQARYPETLVDADQMYLQDGSVYTSAGGSGGIDLALALVERDHGAHIARTVARYLVVFLRRPGGQAQFAACPPVPVDASSPIRVVLDAVVADPTGDHRLPQLAGLAGVSERHLTRLFAEHAGLTPARFVEQTRVEVAQGLLEDTQLSIADIAKQSGFGSPETMRRAFLRVRRILPGAYRERFRSSRSAEPVR